MREVNAIYGGEMSAHHYFRDFYYCDSGMIPWLLVLELLSQTDKSLSQLMEDRIAKFPISGEINTKVQSNEQVKEVMKKLEEKYAGTGEVMKLDGFGVNYPDWRFNVRSSNTEPLIRLNVETRGNKDLLKQKTDELIAVIRG